MPASFIASASGWSLVVMTAVTLSIPFLLRRQLRGVQLRVKFQKGRAFLKRMWPHYWLGYAIAAVTLVHAVLALGSGGGRNADLLGLFLASTALFLVFAQVLLGLNLRRPGIPSRRALRRMHLGLMISIVVLGLGHILLDSPTLHSLFR